MIPKTIHYCWFGRNPLPELAIKCINSWKKYLPDYEIKEWNEDNFDVNSIPYTKEAYEAKKYAFVSDYARFWILYNYGGLYFDTDVEVIKNMDEIIAEGPFMGCEREANEEKKQIGVNAGLGLGAEPKMEFYSEVLDFYNKFHFLEGEGKIKPHTVVTIVTDMLLKKGLRYVNEIQQVEGIYIYPKEYFCPKDYSTGELILTARTISVHHYSYSWGTRKAKLAHWMNKHCPKLLDLIVRLKNIL